MLLFRRDRIEAAYTAASFLAVDFWSSLLQQKEK